MALVKFITKKTTVQPNIFDFYTSIFGMYGSFSEVKAEPTSADM